MKAYRARAANGVPIWLYSDSLGAERHHEQRTQGGQPSRKWRDRKGRHVHYHGEASDFGTNTGFLWRQADDVTVIVLLNSATEAFTREALYSAVLEALG